MIYQLYHNKEEGIIRVAPLRKALYKLSVDKILADQPQDYIGYYNSSYFVSFSRKSLIQKAINLKEEWIKECEAKLEMYKSIKI